MRRLFAAAALLLVTARGPSEPQSAGGPATVRRLTADQYRQSIADIFGPDITVAGRFEPEVRTQGLLAVGTATITVSPAGFEQYDVMARAIAAQVLDEAHRQAALQQFGGCLPADPKGPDRACAEAYLTRVGRLLFRRALGPGEVQTQVDLAGAAATAKGDFHAGLQFALAGLLQSPEFLFRVERAEADPAHPGAQRLTAASRATRLSFLLWNTTPDDGLLRAAESGQLNTPRGLAEEVERLMASPRLEAGVRAFFSDFLGFDAFDQLAKDTVIFEKFSLKVANDAREQTLRTISDLLLAQKGDYRDLFTTRKTFLTRPLGMVYRVPVTIREGWEAHEFAKDDPRAGLLTQIAFTALHSHPGRSSATLRGKAIRELLLCQKVPAPPNNVDFKLVQDTASTEYRTARDRLTAHSNNETCAGCHRIIDPLGLALENFDGIGGFRTRENDAAIDPSGTLDGTAYRDAAGLGQALHDSPAATSCLVNSLYRYAAGREFAEGEQVWQAWLQKRFASDGYRLPDLLRRIALSDGFARITPSAPQSETATQEASR